MGNRVGKTVNGITTHYLVDELSPSGWPQAVEELSILAVTKTYAYGNALLAQTRHSPLATNHSFYVLDSQGSVRALADSTATLTDTYD